MKELSISDSSRKILVDGLKYVIKKMKEKDNPLEKLFYYSDVYGALPRIFNVEFSPTLVHMHMILQTSHATIQNVVAQIVKGGEVVIKIPPNYFETLTTILEELCENIENDRSVYKTLERITNLTYVMVGNGYFLYNKGFPLLG